MEQANYLSLNLSSATTNCVTLSSSEPLCECFFLSKMEIRIIVVATS